MHFIQIGLVVFLFAYFGSYAVCGCSSVCGLLRLCGCSLALDCLSACAFVDSLACLLAVLLVGLLVCETLRLHSCATVWSWIVWGLLWLSWALVGPLFGRVAVFWWVDQCLVDRLFDCCADVLGIKLVATALLVSGCTLPLIPSQFSFSLSSHSH